MRRPTTAGLCLSTAFVVLSAYLIGGFSLIGTQSRISRTPSRLFAVRGASSATCVHTAASSHDDLLCNVCSALQSMSEGTEMAEGEMSAEENTYRCVLSVCWPVYLRWRVFIAGYGVGVAADAPLSRRRPCTGRALRGFAFSSRR